MPDAFSSAGERVMTSSEALELKDIPKKLLVVGGGYIGLELGTVYAALGSEVSLVEALDTLMAGVDPDLVQPVRQAIAKKFRSVRLKTKVLKIVSGSSRSTSSCFVGRERVLRIRHNLPGRG